MLKMSENKTVCEIRITKSSDGEDMRVKGDKKCQEMAAEMVKAKSKPNKET